VKDGIEAIDFLYQQNKFAEAPMPNLIIMDLNLPRKSGLEILAEIKTDENLKRIPVIILSSSNSEKDIARSYDLHANCFVTKLIDLN